MKALVVDCTLTKSPGPSHTEALASQVAARLSEPGVQTEFVRAADLAIAPGVVTDAGDGDEWPRSTGRTMADNLCGVGRALAGRPLRASC